MELNTGQIKRKLAKVARKKAKILIYINNYYIYIYLLKKLRNIENKEIELEKVTLREIIKILELELNKRIDII